MVIIIRCGLAHFTDVHLLLLQLTCIIEMCLKENHCRLYIYTPTQRDMTRFILTTYDISLQLHKPVITIYPETR